MRGYFTPNANYSGDKGPTYDLEYRYINDTAVAFEAYKNNELDIVTSAAEDKAVIDADPELTAQHLTYPGCVHVMSRHVPIQRRSLNRSSPIPRCARRLPMPLTRKAG